MAKKNYYTREQRRRVCQIVHDWMVKNQCHSAEHACQDDTCLVNAIDLVCELAETVGIAYEDESEV